MSSNSGPKTRVRLYAKEHQISYQQAQRKLGFTGAGDKEYALPIGISVKFETTERGYTDYTLCDEETVWRPFSTRTGPCVLIDRFQDLVTSSLAYLAASHPTDPVGDVLMISTISEPEESRFYYWLPTSDPAISFRSFALSNEDIGYDAASAAAAALRSFRPRGIGLVVLEIEDPYDQVTPESNARDFETNYRGTGSEYLFRPQRITDGPYWCERISVGNSIPHVLSADALRGYAELMTEVSHLLDRAARDRIIVLLSGTDLGRTLTRFPVQRFGTRLSAALHLEYEHYPTFKVYREEQALLDQMFPGYQQMFTIPPGETEFGPMLGTTKTPFWFGMNPKNGRVVLARLNDRQTLEWLLLPDPPDVPDSWWSPPYSAYQRRYLRSRTR